MIDWLNELPRHIAMRWVLGLNFAVLFAVIFVIVMIWKAMS